MENQKQKEIDNILSKNLKNKQLIDLAVNMLDTTSILYKFNEPNALYGLFQLGGLSILRDNLNTVSEAINDVDSKIVDLQEDLENE